VVQSLHTSSVIMNMLPNENESTNVNNFMLFWKYNKRFLSHSCSRETQYCELYNIVLCHNFCYFLFCSKLRYILHSRLYGEV